MNNTIYAAASGMITRSNAMNLISNNLSNANTPGFKKDRLLTSDFGNGPVFSFSSTTTEIGETNHGTRGSGTYTRYESGTFEETFRSLDFAIKGDGFFTLTQANGNTALTRDGRFGIDSDGYLVHQSSGAFVMGEKGKLLVNTPDFKVNGNGEIYVNEVLSDKLAITVPRNTDNLRKLSNGLVSNTANTEEFTGSIMQGAIENSNVDITEEMVDMITQSRSYQACSQIIKQMDSVLQKTVTEIGRL